MGGFSLRWPYEGSLDRRAKMTRQSKARLLVLAVLFAACGRAQADTSNTRTLYGEVGLLDMPSARMTNDGAFGLTVGALTGSQRFDLWFQVLPWLEGSFRYSHIKRYGGPTPLYDRSLSLKMRLNEESDDWPDVSLGIRDLLGTGAYGAEYLVASKRFGDLDFTAGLGWGRLATNGGFANPFGLLFKSFKTRDTNFGKGGTISFNTFFHGPKAATFGGVDWTTPIDGLQLLVEYSSDKYTTEQLGGALKIRSPVNVGLSYEVFPSFTVGAGWYYGTSLGVTLSLAANPTVPVTPERLAPPLPEPMIRPPNQQTAALSGLFQRDATRMQTAAMPWVQLPDAHARQRSELAASLMTIGSGVRDIEIDGRTLVIDAPQDAAKAQCAVYAHIASTVDPHVETIAVADLRNGDGQTYICQVSRPVNFIADAADAPPPVDETPARETAAPEPSPEALEEKIRKDIAGQHLRVDAVSSEKAQLWLYYENGQYNSEAEAAGRIARVLMSDAPASVEIFHVVLVQNGLPMREFRLARSALERAASTGASALELRDAVALDVPPLSSPILQRQMVGEYPRLHWSISPGLSEGLFDPNTPLQVQVAAELRASIDLAAGLSVEGLGEVNVFNNYNTSRLSDSLLPHVRTDANFYHRFGQNGIANLTATYRFRVTPEVFAEVKAGYLEDMFAGAGGQVLWRPEGQRVSIGADVYEVWQRSFDRLFGLRDYHILTGHASFYYNSPWYGLNFNVHVGRYLAGDYGATFEVTRRFSTGVEIGAFATFTNVPFATYGEGSFDKGFIIHIPLEWGLPFYTKTSYDLTLHALTRDGGARLYNDDSLASETQPSSFGELWEHLDDIVAP